MKNEFSISPELKNFMVSQSITTLEDLLMIPDEELLELDGFGWRLMREVLLLRESK